MGMFLHGTTGKIRDVDCTVGDDSAYRMLIRIFVRNFTWIFKFHAPLFSARTQQIHGGIDIETESVVQR